MVYLSKYGTERDVEIPTLFEFLKDKKDIKEALDVGCSHGFYLEELAGLVKELHGVDLEKDPDIDKHLKKYFVGDVLNLKMKKYCLVTSLSVVEHYGVKHEVGEDFREKQEALVKRIGELAKRFVYITFPFGVEMIIEGSHTVIDLKQLNRFRRALKGFKIELEYYTNIEPPEGQAWYKIGQKEAEKINHDARVGPRCFCILKGVKSGV